MARCVVNCHDFILPGIFNAKPSSEPLRACHKQSHLLRQSFRSPKNPRIELYSNGRICNRVNQYDKQYGPGPCRICKNSISQPFFPGGGGGGGGGYGGNGGENGNNDVFDNDDGDDDCYNQLWNPSLTGLLILWQVLAKDKSKIHLKRALVWVCCFLHWQSFSALAKTVVTDNPSKEELPVTVDVGDVSDVVWEVKGGKWRKVLVDYVKDAFVFEGDVNGIGCTSQNLEENGVDGVVKSDFGVGKNKKGSGYVLLSSFGWCKNFILDLMLPEGYPRSVTGDYLEYSLWRMLQGIASQMNGVLTTQALLYAVGLGKGAIPTAAAVNWVLKDGIGYLSKILLSKYGRHFDVHPKGWRLFADVLENSACAMELLTPAFPHFFVYLGAVAGAGRSAAGLIQAATRSCFYAGFAAQRNFAEVIAKGEAQGMVSKSLGIMFGIALSNYAGSSGPLLTASFVIVTGFHMFCNLKSYQAVQLRTLNPYRASLVFSEYLSSGSIPSVKEINDEEPIFTRVPLFNIQFKPFLVSSQVLPPETKKAAEDINAKLQLGSKFSDVIHSKGEADALFDLYQGEKYLLAENAGKFLVLLKSGASPQDMMRAMFQVCQLYWLEKRIGIKSRNITDDCKPGGKLMLSLEYMQSEFYMVQQKARTIGWLPDGLVARPLPFRLQLK